MQNRYFVKCFFLNNTFLRTGKIHKEESQQENSGRPKEDFFRGLSSHSIKKILPGQNISPHHRKKLTSLSSVVQERGDADSEKKEIIFTILTKIKQSSARLKIENSP